MQIFFHHVGNEGARRDFQTTVFSRQRISLVEATLPEILKQNGKVIRKLKEIFPNGYFNCWGIPTGGREVISRLAVGDAVILIKKIGVNGSVPAMGIVKAYWHFELKKLSYNLWGSEHYPFIFFFETEELKLSYFEFKKHLGFAENYNPHGEFHIAGENAFPKFRPLSEYIDFLRRNYLRYPEDNAMTTNDIRALFEE